MGVFLESTILLTETAQWNILMDILMIWFSIRQY